MQGALSCTGSATESESESLCDLFTFRASACDSDDLVFTLSSTTES